MDSRETQFMLDATSSLCKKLKSISNSIKLLSLKRMYERFAFMKAKTTKKPLDAASSLYCIGILKEQEI